MESETSARLAGARLRKPRPKYLDLLHIRQPPPAIASILHRISGFGLFAAIPLLLAVFHMSVRSPEEYARVHDWFTHPLAKLVMIGLAWALFHHLFAGIRFLLLDVHVGLELHRARASAVVAIIAALLCTAALGVLLW